MNWQAVDAIGSILAAFFSFLAVAVAVGVVLYQEYFRDRFQRPKVEVCVGTEPPFFTTGEHSKLRIKVVNVGNTVATSVKVFCEDGNSYHPFSPLFRKWTHTGEETWDYLPPNGGTAFCEFAHFENSSPIENTLWLDTHEPFAANGFETLPARVTFVITSKEGILFRGRIEIDASDMCAFGNGRSDAGTIRLTEYPT